MNAVHGTDIDARGVLGADTRLCDNESHDGHLRFEESVVDYTEKLSPQPHEPVEFGLLIVNPEPCKVSTKSIVTSWR